MHKASTTHFARALRDLIDTHKPDMPVSAMRDILARASEELGAPDAPSCAPYTLDKRGNILAHFTLRAQLEQELPNLLELQAICIVSASPPALMAELPILIQTPVHAELELMGRVVHVQGDQVAVQVFSPSPLVTAKLRELVASWEDAPAPAPRPERTSGALPALRASQARATRPGMNLRESGTFTPIRGGEAPVQDPRDGLTPEVSALDEERLAPFLRRLSQPGFDGQVELLQARGPKLIVTLRDGWVIGLEHDPDAPKERIETLLRGAGKITAQQLEQAHERAVSTHVSIADALLDLRMMEYGELRLAMKTRLLFMARNLWKSSWHTAHLYTFDTSSIRTLAPPISLLAQIFEQLKMRAQSELKQLGLEAVRLRFADLKICLEESARAQLDALDFEAKHRRFVQSALCTELSINELLSQSPLGQHDTLLLLSALDSMEMLQKSAVTAFTRQLTRQRNRLDLMLVQVQAKSPFEVLGLHWSAYGDEVARAHEKMMLEFADEHFEDVKGTGELERVREGVGRAFSTLRYAPGRRQLRMELIGDFQIRSSIDVFKKQADSAQLRHDFEAAIDFHRRVLELDAREVESTQMLERLKQALALKNKQR